MGAGQDGPLVFMFLFPGLGFDEVETESLFPLVGRVRFVVVECGIEEGLCASGVK